MHHFNYAGVEWTCTRLELNNWIIPTLVFFLCNKRQRPAVFLKFENRYESIKIWFTFPIFFLFFQNIHILFLLDIYFIINPLTIDLSYCFHQHVSNHFNPYFHKLNFSKKKKKKKNISRHDPIEDRSKGNSISNRRELSSKDRTF